MLVKWLWLVVPLLMIGCVGLGHGDSSRVTTVSGSEFTKLYASNRTPFFHLDYRGIINGYHYLDIYHMGVGSVTRYQGSYRTAVEELPDSFPDHPQKEIASTYSDDELMPPLRED